MPTNFNNFQKIKIIIYKNIIGATNFFININIGLFPAPYKVIALNLLHFQYQIFASFFDFFLSKVITLPNIRGAIQKDSYLPMYKTDTKKR